MGFIQEIEEKETKQGNIFLTDISPSKGNSNTDLSSIININSDFLLVIDSPGGSVRSAPIPFAYKLSREYDQNIIFTMNCRDMNKLAIQSNLLGAEMLGLHQVFIVKGDKFLEERGFPKVVYDYSPTDLISDIVNLNNGIDFQNKQLNSPTSFTIGSAIDFSNNSQRNELQVVRKKYQKGTDFFISQPCYDMNLITDFHNKYYKKYGNGLEKPIFYGVQLLSKNGKNWGHIPEDIIKQLENSNSPLEIAFNFIQQLSSIGLNKIYLIPPIGQNGTRDYNMAELLIKRIRGI
tara:strand:- start:13 stop:885 length:873 start_codon:yes stop_codon:yes gene_type:complete